ncbi:MAG TPA: hypothetical protein VMV68_02925 [Spirochaetia bacterium]|nr:hypothetical protein [Spirochaetia bacterium]
MPKITNTEVTAFTIKAVDRELANRFRAACHLSGRQYRDVLLELMERYARENLPLKSSGDHNAASRKG